MLRIIMGSLVLAAVGLGGYAGFREWIAAEPDARYRTAPVERGTLVATVTATGNLEPLVKVLVGSQVSGTVTRWYADFNQRVEDGFVLAELDKDRFTAVIDQRKAAARAATARIEEAAAGLADAVLKREHTESNFKQHAATELELSEARIAEQMAEATLHAAEAELDRAKADERMAAVDLDRTIIRSPIDGVVISRDIDAGQTVAASLQAPTLFTIANDLAKMQVNAAVSETDIGKIVEGGLAEFRVDAYPNRRFHGVISQVRYAETIVDNVVTYTTLIYVDNDDLALRPGMTATISFEVARAEDVLIVPNAAMRFNPATTPQLANSRRPGRARPMAPRVYKLAGGQLVEVPIDPGLTDGSATEIRSGDLREGSEVVIERLRGTNGFSSGIPRFGG